MKYNKFTIRNYRAITDSIEINVKNNKLVPLIGANESGKTTILQAIYAFDYANDKEYEGRHLADLRNFYNPQSKEPAIIEAEISISKKDFLNCIGQEEVRLRYNDLANFSSVLITRNLETKKYSISVIDNIEDSDMIAREIVSRLPYIIYNDDFIERPKNEIVIPDSDNELFGWVGIYERAFNKVGSSLFQIIKEPEDNIRFGILSDVESEINKTLIKEWGKISLDDGGCLSIKLLLQESNTLRVQIVEKKGERDRFFKIEERSKGFLWFFNFVMKIKYNPKATGSNNDIIYLLDEPGSYLHPVAQEKLCRMIKNISSKDGKVVYCTHTHHLLDPKHIPTKCIYLVQKNKADKNIQLCRVLDVETNFKKVSELQPVYEALGIADWDFFTHEQKVILVEGIYDKYALDLFLDLPDDEFVIMPGVNANSIYDNIPRMIAYGKKYVAIWDNDQEGRKFFEKSVKAFGKNESSKFLLLPGSGDKFRMEEMFDIDSLSKIADCLEMPKSSSYEHIVTCLVGSSDAKIEECKKCISDKTKANFKTLRSNIMKALKTPKR